MSRESGGAPGGGGNHNGGVNGGGANSGSSSKGSGGGGKGSGKNDSNSKGSGGSSTSKGTSSSASTSKSAPASTGKSTVSNKAGSSSANSGSVGAGKVGGNLAGGNGLAGGMSEAEQRGAYSAGRAAAQAIGSGSVKASDGSLSASGNQTGKGGVASRVSSINQTLSSYGSAARTSSQKAQASQSLASTPTGQVANANMSEADQRAAYSAGAAVARDHGVIANLVNRANQGIATKEERARLDRIEGAATRHSAATVVGSTALGSPGSYIGNGLASLFDGDDYDAQLGKRVGTGEMKGVLGSINDKFGQGGIADTALGVAANTASAVMPGASLVLNAISNGLRAPNASAIAEMRKALGKPVGVGSGTSNLSDRDYTEPPRQSLTGPAQSNGASAFDSSSYDPSRFSVTAGQRRY